MQLQGVKSLKLAQDAEVEIKAGTLYRKRLYKGVPLVFDTGAAADRRRRPHHLAQRPDSERNQSGHRQAVHAMRKRNASPAPAR